MRKLIFVMTFYFLCQVSQVLGQITFPVYEHNPQWTLSFEFWGEPYGIENLAYNDTVNLCGKKYSKAIEANTNQVFGYIRTDDSKVWVRKSGDCTNKEYLMYDFSLEQDSTTYIGFNVHTSSIGGTDTMLVKVLNIDTINVIGFSGTVLSNDKKKMDVQLYYKESWDTTWQFWYSDTWVEGIGSLMHPFYSLAELGDHTETFYTLVCHENEGTLLYAASASCVTGILEPHPSTAVLTYPNPFQENFSLELPITINQARIEITDLSGKMFYAGHVKSGLVTLNGHHFNSGIYIVKVITPDEVYVSKVIKK